MTDVVVGIDSSTAAAGALVRAMDEAERSGEALRVVHVWQTPMWVGGPPGFTYDAAPSEESAERWAKAVLDEVVDRALAERTAPLAVPLTREVRHGATSGELLAASAGATLLVVGGRAHGKLASALLGSTTNEVLHQATCPVLLVPDPAPPLLPWERVVVGVDGSSNAGAALRWAARVARRDGIPLVVVHAWQLSTLPSRSSGPSAGDFPSEAAAWLGHEVERQLPDQAGLDVRLHPVHATASAALLERSTERDLLVLGARGQGGFTGLLMGSVAVQCARHAHGALAILRADDATGA